MIIDTLPDKQKQERRYLIYDMVAINGQSVVEVGTVIIYFCDKKWLDWWFPCFTLFQRNLKLFSSRSEYVLRHIVNTVAAITLIIEY